MLNNGKKKCCAVPPFVTLEVQKTNGEWNIDLSPHPENAAPTCRNAVLDAETYKTMDVV